MEVLKKKSLCHCFQFKSAIDNDFLLPIACLLLTLIVHKHYEKVYNYLKRGGLVLLFRLPFPLFSLAVFFEIVLNQKAGIKLPTSHLIP